MKILEFGFIYENIWLIVGFIILSIPFYIWFYKSNNTNVDFKKIDAVNKKNLYLNRIDIIGNKVFIIISIVLSIIISLIFLIIE